VIKQEIESQIQALVTHRKELIKLRTFAANAQDKAEIQMEICEVSNQIRDLRMSLYEGKL